LKHPIVNDDLDVASRLGHPRGEGVSARLGGGAGREHQWLTTINIDPPASIYGSDV
jgi:hypothetical protein